MAKSVGAPRPGRDFPRSPVDELTDPLDDLLAHFPNPVGWSPGTPVDFDGLMSSARPSTELEGPIQQEPESFIKPLVPVKLEVASEVRPVPLKFGSSGSIKRPSETAHSTPTRPFKRLRDAFSPKSPKESKHVRTPRPSTSHSHIPRSPTKIPLPRSPSDKSLPTPPSDVDDILVSFRFTRMHLNRSIEALEGVRTEILAERDKSESTRVRLEEVLAERKTKDQALLEAWGESEDLRIALKKARLERGKAAQESQGIIGHLETRLNEANGTITSIRNTLSSLTDSRRSLEESSDRQLFTLQQELDAARQETARAKVEVAELKGRLDEAEFAHRALKEGGARLARELADKEKRVDELERAKAAKRGGMV